VFEIFWIYALLNFSCRQYCNRLQLPVLDAWSRFIRKAQNKWLFLPSSIFHSFAFLFLLYLFLSAKYLNFADSTLPTHDAFRRKGKRMHVERGQYLYWTRERVSESSRGISSGNLQGPDVARRYRRLMPRAVVASPVALVSSSCLSDRMPIEVRRRRQRRWEKNEET